VYIKLVVLLRNYVTMMHGQQNIKNGWATIVVVGRLRVNEPLEISTWRLVWVCEERYLLTEYKQDEGVKLYVSN
jgi:hypothetical protein